MEKDIRLYWNYITTYDWPETWVATTYPLMCGQSIQFKDTVGYIERVKDGSFSCYDGKTNRYLGNEPTKEHAKAIIQNEYAKYLFLISKEKIHANSQIPI